MPAFRIVRVAVFGFAMSSPPRCERRRGTSVCPGVQLKADGCGGGCVGSTLSRRTVYKRLVKQIARTYTSSAFYDSNCRDGRHLLAVFFRGKAVSRCVRRRPGRVRVSPFTWIRRGPAGWVSTSTNGAWPVARLLRRDERLISERVESQRPLRRATTCRHLVGSCEPPPYFADCTAAGQSNPGGHEPESRVRRARSVSPGGRYPSCEG